ncbi:MAG: DUF4870 domain-containing protein [Pseudomonadota bacterium]
MVNRLPVWIFLSIALLMIGLALLPLMRVVLGIDEQFAMQFFTVIMLLIGGIMSGLTAMILMVRRQPRLDWSKSEAGEQNDGSQRVVLQMHACGLLLFSGIPLLNFLLAFWLWLKHRHSSQYVDLQGQEVLNYQVSLYLYLLLSLFMVFAGIGLLTTPLLLVLHLIFVVIALVLTSKGKEFKYPINIPIIQGRRPAAQQN